MARADSFTAPPCFIAHAIKKVDIVLPVRSTPNCVSRLLSVHILYSDLSGCTKNVPCCCCILFLFSLSFQATCTHVRLSAVVGGDDILAEDSAKELVSVLQVLAC